MKPASTCPLGKSVAIITNNPPMRIKIEVPKLTSNSLLILIIVAQTDHKKPEAMPNISARELGKILPLSNPVIIKRPVKPAAMEKALYIVKGVLKNAISIIVLQTAVR